MQPVTFNGQSIRPGKVVCIGKNYAALIADVNKMQSRLEAIAYNFKEEAPKTDLDTQLIDALVATANTLLTSTETIKSIEYDPTPIDTDGG